jgi:Phosphodiester glycosidase
MALLAAALSCVLVAGCGGGSGGPAAGSGNGGGSSPARAAKTASSVATTAATTPAPVRPPPPRLVVSVPAFFGGGWRPVARFGETVAAWVAQRGGVTLMRFDQSVARLALHAGASEPGGTGWRYGDSIGPAEVHRVIAGFNGGFKLSYRGQGFVSYGRVADPLQSGLASIVTYRDGTTQIGTWHAGVPAAGKPIASVRQNLGLLIDHGQTAATAESCVQACWGETLGGGSAVARSALGIDAAGRLVWAAGESLTPGQLAEAMVAVGVQRAVELDINPFWVAGYLYEHGPSGPHPVPVVPGQHGIEGELLGPDNRDFFTVSVR